jgi:hypothetical protein
MHKSATKCNETIGKWCKNKNGASKIIDTLETYQTTPLLLSRAPLDVRTTPPGLLSQAPFACGHHISNEKVINTLTLPTTL